MLNFGNVNTEIPLPNSYCSSVKCAWSAQSEINCGNAIAEIGEKNCDKLIVAMALPKQGKTICDKLIVAMPLPKQGKKKIMTN